MQHTSIYLHGFRATGKSTIGQLLANQLNWQFTEMDQLITERAGQAVNQLTQSGTNWTNFRNLEQQLLIDLLPQSRLVVSTGGGLCVNDVINPHTNQPYGQENLQLLNQHSAHLSILLETDQHKTANRIRRDELAESDTQRPILNPQRAHQLQTQLNHAPAETHQSLIVEAIVEDALDTYQKRRPFYHQITSHIIDTGQLYPKQAVEDIIKILNTELH
jgi:shikimate kinase